MAISPTDDTVRFGLFELDPKAGQLSRNGTKIRLTQQPLQLLTVLLERPGEVLPREELRQRLWPSDVFVDFDHGLNKSIQKLRDALGDSADSPCYIETIPRVGYRFIAPVSFISPADGGARMPAQETPGDASVVPPDTVAEQRTAAIAGLVRIRRMRWLLLAVGGAVVVVAITGGWFIHGRIQATEPIRSLAVLPLDNLSGDPGQNYLADGMTDELTTMLAKDSTLRITSRTSAMQYKGVHRPLREIARALGVDGILEGSIERSGDKVHMTIQLIHAATDTHVWADSYDRDANDIVSLPSEAAQTIAKNLHSTVPQPATQRYISPEAHDAYLRGRYLWQYGNNAEAGKYFKKATELQPDYALGWSGLADYYGQGAGNELNPEEALPEEDAAARKAIELDDSLAQGHLSMGAAMFFHRWNWAGAEQEINRAIELNPENSESYQLRSMLYSALNRDEESIEAAKKAMELNPFARPYAMAYAYIYVRQYDAAIADSRARLESQPESPDFHWTLGGALRRKGGAEKEVVQESEKMRLAMGDKAGAAIIQHQFERGGYKEVLRGELSHDKDLAAKKQYVSPFAVALTYAQLGDREQTLAHLEEGYRQREPAMLWIQREPAYDFLHNEPRYRAIIQGMGLPPSY